MIYFEAELLCLNGKSADVGRKRRDEMKRGQCRCKQIDTLISGSVIILHRKVSVEQERPIVNSQESALNLASCSEDTFCGSSAL